MTLVLTGGTVLVALNPLRLVDADLAVEDGRIRAVRLRSGRPAGPSPTIEGQRPPAESLENDGSGTSSRDCSGCLIIPGNVCAHTHLYSALARGMPGPTSAPRTFLEILRRVWWQLDRALDEPSIRASALVGGAEALLSGTTALIDHHASPNAIDGSLDVVADALARLGIRAVLCYETTDRDGEDRAKAGVRENARFLARTRLGAYRLARGMVGAHASFTLSEDTLEACVDTANAGKAGIHIHLAEGEIDERDSSARFGRRVVQRLDRAGALNERTLVAHAVQVDALEAATLTASGALVVHNARSNMNNGVGRAPLHLLGRLVALGTDGIGADMFEESRSAYLRLREDGEGADPGWPLARLAEGARFVGRRFDESQLGRIEVGAPADLVVLAYDPPTPLDETSLADHWVFGLGAGAVRDVLVGGELVVADRQLTRMDLAQLVANARQEAVGLWERMARIGPHPFEPPFERGTARPALPGRRSRG